MAVIIVEIVLVTLVIIFSVQNAAPVAVAFLGWHTQASLSIIIFLSLVIGVVIGITLSSFWAFKRAARKKEKEQKVGGT